MRWTSLDTCFLRTLDVQLTLNLVATSDSAATQLDAQYSQITQSMFTKCSALWRKHSQSNILDNLIKGHCGV